jgi:hypothetical protein
MEADGTKIVDGNNATCVIGPMRGTGDVPVLDESRTPSWTVRKSSQKSRMMDRVKYRTKCESPQVREKDIEKQKRGITTSYHVIYQDTRACDHSTSGRVQLSKPSDKIPELHR